MEKEKVSDVLFVEDNLDDSDLTFYSLEKANNNIKPLHFRNGEDALHYLREGKADFGRSAIDRLRLIIIDLNLHSELNGLEIIRQIRANEKSRSIPVVVFSGSSSHEDVYRAYELGANSYVIKPAGFDGYVKKLGSIANYWCKINERLFEI